MSRVKSTAVGLKRALGGAAVAALLFAAALTVRSVVHFTTTGPTIRQEVVEHFLPYTLYAVGRLGLVAFLIAVALAVSGMLVHAAFLSRRESPGWIEGFIAGGIGIFVGFAYQFAHTLIFEPSTIMASWAYAPSRLVTVWPHLHYPDGLVVIRFILYALVGVSIICLLIRRLRMRERRAAVLLAAPAFLAMVGGIWLHWESEPGVGRGGAAHASSGSGALPNIVMIGNDTMRADRIGIGKAYERKLTPFIDSLATRGTYFSEAYVPQARTAPSIATILTGAWTDTHTITSNFVRDGQARLNMLTLPRLLSEHGYRTVAIGDWAASDIGKIDFGFDELSVSPDQWNFKYLLRQGPRDLRLFVSIFVGNKLGRRFVPELYYLAGRPLTTAKARDARHALSRLASGSDPFLLMLFVATSHGPFGSEYPYYTLFSGANYAGESKFAMTRVSSPEEIERRQAQGREAFDVQQLIDLYDGTVRHFDDEVRRIVMHLERLGIADNTIIVVFSDHGTDFFERGTWGQGNVVGARDYSGHIPLLFVDPRRQGGAVIPRLVRSVDIAPTVAELAGVDAGTQFEGTSLVPYIDKVEQDMRLAAYTESGELISKVRGLREDQLRAPNLLELLEIPDKRTGTIAIAEEGMKAIENARQRLIRTERWAAIMLPLVSGEEFFLFDLKQNQDSLDDVSATYPATMACFKPAFDEHSALHRRLDALSSCLERTPE